MIGLDEPELGERLRVTARHATADLAVVDPTADAVMAHIALAPPAVALPERATRRRRARRGLVGAVAAAVVGVVALGVATGAGDRADSSRVDAAGDGAPDPTPAALDESLTPAERLRAAVAETQASEPFRLVADGTIANGGAMPDHRSMGSPPALGSGASGMFSITTYERGLIATSWTDGTTESPVALIVDTKHRTVLWQEGDGQWRRAPLTEEPVWTTDLLDIWGAAQCVVSTGPATLVIVVGDPCGEDPAADPLALHVEIGSDGRIVQVEQRAAAPAQGWTSTVEYDPAPIAVPAEAEAISAPTPNGFGWSWGVGAGTSRPIPMYPPGVGG